MVPVFEIVACSTTVPETRAALAMGGYKGTVFLKQHAGCDAARDVYFLGSFGLDLGALPLPKTLPITPLLLPPKPSMPATPKPELEELLSQKRS